MAELSGFDDGIHQKSGGNGFLSAIMHGIGLGDLWNSLTGSGLTSSEIQQNEFNAAEAQKARDFNAEQAQLQRDFSAEQAQVQRDWQTQMDNTKVQRSVEDMKAAGVNPAMMMGGAGVTASTPSGAAASGSAASGPAASGSSHGANPGALIELLFAKQRYDATKAQIGNLKAETKNIEADTANKEADTANKEESTRGQKISNDFAEQTFDARKRSIELQNEVNEGTRDKIYQEKYKLLAETSESQTRALLNNVTASNIIALQPYYQLEMESRATANSAAAKAQLVAAAYQQGLIDNGMIEAAVKETNSRVTANDAEAHYKHIMELVESGNTSQLAKELGDGGAGSLDIYLSDIFSKAGSLFSMIPNVGKK